MNDGQLTKRQVESLAKRVGTSIAELAREAGLNHTVLYRKKPQDKVAPKSSVSLLEAAEKIEARNSRMAAVV